MIFVTTSLAPIMWGSVLKKKIQKGLAQEAFQFFFPCDLNANQIFFPREQERKKINRKIFWRIGLGNLERKKS